ncbi:15194_t:CDS:2, partial [Entrophospora sp. SA101]
MATRTCAEYVKKLKVTRSDPTMNYQSHMIAKYKIARGGSHIKTPKAIANKATNKSNADRLIEGKQTHLEHLSILKNYTHLVNFESILDGKPVP